MSEQINKTLSDRGSSYGDFNQQFKMAQELKRIVCHNIEDPVLKEAAEMICTKLSRLGSGNEMHEDSWHDVAGYAELARKRSIYLVQPKVMTGQPTSGTGHGWPPVV